MGGTRLREVKSHMEVQLYNPYESGTNFVSISYLICRRNILQNQIE